MSNNTPIPKWQNFYKPRDKMIQLGPKLLSTSELIALVINNGNKQESALDISRKLLASTKDGLNDLAKIDYSNLRAFSGIGKAKACQLLALFELTNRIQNSTVKLKDGIQSSTQAHATMKGLFANQKYEQFWVLLLNRANKVLGKVQISEGGVFETTVDPIKIFKNAMQLCATGIILFHNHPSDHLKPSKADITLTKRLTKGAQLLNISILDHLIIGTNRYYSFKDEGLLD
jgi:DNA repair protein RadC